MSKTERRKERKSARKIARAILHRRYGIGLTYTQNYHAIHRYIKQFCPELKSDGYQLFSEFCAKHPRNSAISTKPALDSFLESFEWRKIRMVVLKRDGAVCACCGASRKDGVRMHVDHIKPRKIYPELALDPDNLQVLCEVCNHGKGNWDMTDWRDEFPAEQKSHLKAIK